MSVSTQTVTPISVANFLNTLGVDTHMAYTDGGYANVAQVISDLKYLGIDQVRDGITNGLDPNGNANGSAPLSTYLTMAQAGIKFTFIIEATSSAVIATQLALINQVEAAVPGSVLAIEGPNEVDNDPITFNGLTGQAAATAAQQALYAAVKADSTLAGVPVDYFTGYAVGSTDPTTTPGLADFDNQHPYPNFGEAPAFWVSRAQALTNLGSSDVATAPAVYTETGYSTTQVPADVQAKYTLDLLMDTAKDGISQTYLYDLLDAYAPGSPQGDDGFGQFDYTGAAKPVAAAIHSLTTLLQDTGTTAATFKPAALSYSISNLPTTGNSMLMEKSNGTYVLVVWAEPEIFNINTGQEVAAPTESVTVTLPQLFGSVQVFDPTSGTSPVASYSNSSSVSFTLADHPIVIELGAAVSTTTAPVLTITAPVQVANTTEIALSGTVTDPTQTTVQVMDGSTVLGSATVSNGSWSYTSASLTAGTHNFSAVATDANGNTATAADAAFTIAAPALVITYNSGIDTSSTTRTVSVTTPITIGSTGSDTITLAMAEDAYLGDAKFTVSVDGVQIGGVQTTTALHSAGVSQNFTLLGNFGAGTHTVSVNFLNDAVAVYSNGSIAGDRNLYVDSITGDGKTKVENVEENLAGSTSYTIKLPATSVAKVAPVVTLAAAPSVLAGGTATLGTATPGNSGDALTVKLVSDGDFTTGSSVVLSNGSLVYAPGTITAANAGTDTISYTVTDSTNGLVTTETQKVTLVAPVVKPTVSITSQVLTKDTGTSATDDITSNGAVKLAGTVTGATGTVVTILDGTTVLGTATITSGKWTYSTILGAGAHTLHAVATDTSGNTVASAAEPSITVDTTAPVLTIATPVQVANTTEVTLSGKVTDSTVTTVQIKDGSTVLGNATVTNGKWSFTSANLAAGSNVFSASATDLAGNVSTASAAAFTIAAPALSIVYSSGVDTSTTTRSVSVTTPVTVASTGTDTITLAMAEDAYLGDAQFTVSVDGKQIGGVQTVTALHSAGLSENFTLLGNFGAGTHTVAVDFLNDAVAIYSNGAIAGDRNLYVDSITGDGVTKVENVEENLGGTISYTIKLPATSVAKTAPVVTLAAAPSATPGGTAVLGSATPGNSGDTLTVKLLSDGDFTSGSSVVLSSGNLVYTPGTITAANAGTDSISYIVTDSTNGLTTVETQKVTLVAPVVKPTVSITSQVLTKDTGISTTDDITYNGAVTLAGTVTGASGTVVTILDGTIVLGTATIANGTWTYSTTLGSGAHTLHAVATDTSGNTVASAAEPTITVDKTAPALTIATPVQVAGTTGVTLTGTVTDATATTVQIKDGSTVLGSATVINGSWSYTSGSLTAGSNVFSATAMDLAGNVSTVSAAAFTIVSTTPVANPDQLLATVSTGTGTTQVEVNLSSATPITGTFVPVSTSGIGANSLVLYNWNPATQLQGFLADQAAGTASIVGIGDSFTDGFGSAASGWSQLSYLNEMTQALKQDGVAAQSDNFLGSEFYITNGSIDNDRVTPVGYPAGSLYDGGFTIVAGGNAIYLNGAGKGFNFQLDTPGNYNEVTLSYIDVGSGTVNLAANGVSVGNLTLGNTGQTLTQTVKIPAGSYSDLVVTSTSANPVYIQGAAFSSTTNPAIQVYNAGIGGWDSGSADTSVYMGQSLKGSANGFGQTASAAALKPSLALIDLGTNDIASAVDTTAQSLANIEQIVATLQAAGTDVIIMIPQPFGSSAYATALPALRSGLEAYSLANNVPLIDLSATYGNSEAALEAAGLKSDLLHGDATFYADIGSQLASLLSKTITTAAASTTATAAVVKSAAVTDTVTKATVTSSVTASAASKMEFLRPASETTSTKAVDFSAAKADLLATRSNNLWAMHSPATALGLSNISNSLRANASIGAGLMNSTDSRHDIRLAHVHTSVAS